MKEEGIMIGCWTLFLAKMKGLITSHIQQDNTVSKNQFDTSTQQTML